MRHCLFIIGFMSIQAIAANDQPNIVFILAEDLGIGDVKCDGGERCQIATPNMDALAKGGMRFTDAHVSASVCVSSRVAIMTGRYPWRFGSAQPGGPRGFLGPRFDTNTLTLAKMLHRVGYDSGYIGVWVKQYQKNRCYSSEKLRISLQCVAQPRFNV